MNGVCVVVLPAAVPVVTDLCTVCGAATTLRTRCAACDTAFRASVAGIAPMPLPPGFASRRRTVTAAEAAVALAAVAAAIDAEPDTAASAASTAGARR